jgi:hypothetical protein
MSSHGPGPCLCAQRGGRARTRCTSGASSPCQCPLPGTGSTDDSKSGAPANSINAVVAGRPCTSNTRMRPSTCAWGVGLISDAAPFPSGDSASKRTPSDPAPPDREPAPWEDSVVEGRALVAFNLSSVPYPNLPKVNTTTIRTIAAIKRQIKRDMAMNRSRGPTRQTT